ncbi:MAG TPA: prenyltransferase/squalene oxidase repeat-containing protein [Gemmataceae bacterium]|nr:prenyltransferase/squalene oxidase repeat-containing protein [Gemmataceae bacterium]
MNPVLFIPLAGLVLLSAEEEPEARAVAFLVREVPSWSVENKCYSCHNNGDAARALYHAIRLGRPLPARALAETSRWLARPDGWDKNGGEGGPSDTGLARVQFAAALVDALDAGAVKGQKALLRAAELVAEHQKEDGSWRPDGEVIIGAPATYGACLMTYQARRVLLRADPQRHREAIARADRWLRQVEVKSVLDAAAVLLALAGNDDAEARTQRRHCLELIRRGESKDGGWGPYVTSFPEPFDTAVVLLALTALGEEKDVAAMIERGRAYLIRTQQEDGSWRETTRPAGGESYAQRISTCGWATLALLATQGRPSRK